MSPIQSFFKHYLSSLNQNSIGVEVGVRRGDLSQFILENYTGRLVCVDYWDEQPPGIYKEEGNAKAFQQKHFNEYIDKTKKFEERRLTVANLSTLAAGFFPNEYFDFIYIDANHEYDEVVKDLDAWWPKVKSGGLFSGDDWIEGFKPNDGKNMTVYWEQYYCGVFGVNPAVENFTNKHGYKINVVTMPNNFNMWYLYKR